MSWNVLITARAANDAGRQAVERLRQAGCQVAFTSPFGPYPAERLVELLRGYDAVLASSDAYSAAVFSAADLARLKVVSRWGVGTDSVDLAAATAAGVVVAYTPGLLDECVADYAWALLCAVARGIHAGHASMREGKWEVTWGHAIHGRTLGIVGCGRIGRAMARRAAGFGMRLLGYDLHPTPEAERLGVRFVSLDELLAESDFVSLHAALTSSSRGLIGPRELARMKPTAYLVNTARGAMIDDEALLDALEHRRLAGAALDAFAAEPLPPDHPLRRCEHLLVTPHQAFNAVETGEQVSLVAATAIIDCMTGRRPQFVANPDVLSSPALRVRLA